jgi:hypothetical protein
MPYDPNEDSKTKRLNEWMRQARSEGLVDGDFVWVSGKEEAIKQWLDRGRKTGVLLLAGALDPSEQDGLQKRFRAVITLLLTFMAVGLLMVGLGIGSSTMPPLLVSVAAGLLGSATAAFISCLNRRANGFEDKLGNTFPDPMENKERFGQSMSYWLMCRPFLGAVMGGIAYWGMAGGVFISAEKAKAFPGELAKVAFVGAVAELFAKTLYDILQNILKSTFKTQRPNNALHPTVAGASVSDRG